MTKVVLTWQDEPGRGGEIDSPRADQIRQQLLSLDGAWRSTLVIDRGRQQFVVGGSAESGVIAYVDNGRGKLWQLMSSTTDSESLVEVVAGELGEYPAKYVATINDVLTAAEEFVESGSLSSGLSWEEYA